MIGRKHSFQTETVVEPNEEEQLYFAGPLPDELNKDAYILVAIDKWLKFPYMIQKLKRRLEVMRIDQTNTPYKLVSDIAEIINNVTYHTTRCNKNFTF